MPIFVPPQTLGPANPAGPSDLSARGYTGDSTIGQTRLDEAWRALRLEVPSLLGRLTSGDLDQAAVVDVICAAALRILRNPDGHSQEANQVDDFRESWSRSDASSDLYFTAAELRRVSPTAFQNAGSFKYS